MKNITNNLPKQPAAKIIVDGLFILCLDEKANKVELGVYEYANQHDFFIRVSKKEHGSKTVLFKGGKLIRKLDSKNEIKTGDVKISLSQSSPHITCYQHSALTEESFLVDASKTNSEIALKSKEYGPDFRWVIDLESARFHGRKLDVVPGVIHRKISILNGVLHTEKLAIRTIANAYPMAAKMAKIESSPRHYFVANQLAIAIEKLGADNTIDISYFQKDKKGVIKNKVLSLGETEKEVYYEILISNNCSDGVSKANDRQSDFQHYYNAISVPTVERLEMTVPGGQGSNRYPCDLIFLGATPELPSINTGSDKSA